MKKLLPILSVLIITSCSDPETISTTPISTTPISTTSNKLIEKNNVSFLGDSKTPFNGEIFDYHSNKNLKMTGTFIDGKKEGQWNIYFFEPKDGNPVKEYEESYVNGKKNGKFIHFESNGKDIESINEWTNGVFKEYLGFRYESGSRSLNARTYHKNNKIYRIEYPKYDNDYQPLIVDKNYKGKIYCDVTDKQNNITTSFGNDQHTDGKAYSSDGLSFETWKDCKLNGETEEYRNTFLYKKGFYKDHKQTGRWTTFSLDTEEPTTIENYKEDRLHGLSQNFDSDGNGILLDETEYKNGKKDGIQKFYDKKTKKLSYLENYAKGELKKSVAYANLNSRYTGVNLYDFWYVMSAYGAGKKNAIDANNKVGWSYINKSCKPVYRKNSQDSISCLDSIKGLIIIPDSPIKITANYQGGILHGPFEISDPDDGHIYTSIEYFRGGKYGEYKITNKEGSVVFSVNCLKGGKDFTAYYQGRDNFSGNCRKDGEQVQYVRSIFSPNQSWVLHSKKVFQNDRIDKEEYFIDPYYQEGMLWGGTDSFKPGSYFNGSVVLPFVNDPSLIKD